MSFNQNRLPDQNGVLQTLQIPVISALGRRIIQLFDGWGRRLEPAPYFRMAIRKRQTAALVVPRGGRILKNGGIRSNRNGKITVIYRPVVLIDEDHAFDWFRLLNVGQLAKIRISRALHPVNIAIHSSIHRETANFGFGRDFTVDDRALIRRTAIGLDGGVIFIKQAPPDVGLVGGSWVKGDIVLNPGFVGRVANPVGNQHLIVIPGVKDPAHRQLLQVADAANAERFGLGLAERRQQHARQNGDNGDDHEQFDERESGSPRGPQSLE